MMSDDGDDDDDDDDALSFSLFLYISSSFSLLSLKRFLVLVLRKAERSLIAYIE